MQTINVHIYNECKKYNKQKATKTLILESARRDSLREDGPAEVNFSRSPAESPAVALREKPAGKERNNRAATVRYLSQKRERKRSK